MQQKSETERTRSVAWRDPRGAIEAAREMPGIDYLSAMGAGDLPFPPFLVLVGIEPVEVRAGLATFAIDPGEHHYNALGGVHGGLLATLLDTALGCAIHSTLPAGVGYTTLELHVNFVRAVTAKTGRLTCTGEVVHAGRRVATSQARVVDADGRLYAHATTTCLILAAGHGATPSDGGASSEGAA